MQGKLEDPMSCSLLYANIKIIPLWQIINQIQITDSNRVTLQEDHVSKHLGGGDCAGKDLPSEFVAYSRVPSSYRSIFEISLGSLLLGLLIVSHIFCNTSAFHGIIINILYCHHITGQISQLGPTAPFYLLKSSSLVTLPFHYSLCQVTIWR